MYHIMDKVRREHHMTAKETYKIWAPSGKKWVDWVRPVPFLGIGKYSKAYGVSNLPLPRVNFVETSEENVLGAILGLRGWGKNYLDTTAIIVDLSGEKSVCYGVSLAKLGFRPIPVYNGTLEPPRARATVDNQSVGMAPEHWAYELKNIDIADDARPAFLLDRNRLVRYKAEDSIYDNSWDVYPQDLPSPLYLLDNGITNILVVGGRKISRDVKNILGKHQRKGLNIYHTDGYEKPKRKYIFQMPSWD